MSGLEALGIACNILQLIGYAVDTVQLCKRVYKGEEPGEGMLHAARALDTLSADLQNQKQLPGKPLTRNQRSLTDIADKCNVASRALQDEIQFLSLQQAEGKLAATLKLVVKTKWRQKRLEKLQNSLNEYKDAMRTSLLAHICTQNDASLLQNSEKFDSLSKDMQKVIENFASGNGQVQDLVKASESSLRSHINSASIRTEAAVKKHITSEVAASQVAIKTSISSELRSATDLVVREIKSQDVKTASVKEREKLLQSIKFPAMNERRNQVDSHHEGTFNWIFHDPSGTRYSDDTEDSPISSSGLSGSTGEDHTVRPLTPPTTPPSTPGSDKKLEFPPSTALVEDEAPERQLEIDFRTGEYVMKWDSFPDWLRSNNGIYWIHGKPGSGKSTLMRFLMEHPHTMHDLRYWAPDVVILSHFFWKPGSPMQKNLKGLYCSIAHQLLSRQPSLIDEVCGGSKSLLSKDIIEDWSLKEIKSVCLESAKKSSCHLCIFIDGLDEALEKGGASQLIQAIHDFRAMKHVKVCISSRPETALYDRLERFHQLQVQDLTAYDMEIVSRELLQPMYEAGSVSPETIEEFIQQVQVKAQGVFLWLQLAIRTLCEGVENGDTEDDLKHRLDEMPSELTDLYWDIWYRTNGHTGVYRSEAAQYFNLLIAAQELSVALDRASPVSGSLRTKGDLRSGSITVFEAVIATDPALRDDLKSQDLDIYSEEFRDNCMGLIESILHRCGGLVEVKIRDMELPVWLNSYEKIKVAPFFECYITFIHRTAYDFLLDSEDGQHILSFDSVSTCQLQIHLLIGWITQNRYYQPLSQYDNLPAIGRVVTPDVLFRFLKYNHHPFEETDLHHVLQLYMRWYEEGYFCGSDKCKIGFPWRWRPHFLAIAALSGCRSFVLNQLRHVSEIQGTGTSVLLALFSLDNSGRRFDSSNQAHQFIKPCVDLMNDSKHGHESVFDIPQMHIPRQLEALGPEEDLQFVAHNSLFGAFLLLVLQAFSHTDESIDEKYLLECLSLFQQSRFDLDERICMLAKVSSHKYALGRKRRIDLWTLTEAWDSIQKNHMAGDGAIIIEANLSYWLRLIFRRACSGDATFSMPTPTAAPQPTAVISCLWLNSRDGDSSFYSTPYHIVDEDLAESLLAKFEYCYVANTRDQRVNCNPVWHALSQEIDEIWDNKQTCVEEYTQPLLSVVSARRAGFREKKSVMRDDGHIGQG